MCVGCMFRCVWLGSGLLYGELRPLIWSPETHRHFPESFRRAVRHVLLSWSVQRTAAQSTLSTASAAAPAAATTTTTTTTNTTLVQAAPKGRIARVLAANAALAGRMDALGDTTATAAVANVQAPLPLSRVPKVVLFQILSFCGRNWF
jgi:hypothetical protein